MKFNKNPIFIGLSGKIGSGKDTVAKIIAEEFPEHNFHIKSFASGVRNIYNVLCPYDRIPEECTQDWKKNNNPMFAIARRSMLEGIGEGIRQHVHEDIWAWTLFYNNVRYGHNLIIPDVRYKNELTMIRKFDGHVFRVVRTNNPHPQTEHISNCDLDYEDLPIIANTDSLESLRANVVIALLPYLEKEQGYGDVQGF